MILDEWVEQYCPELKKQFEVHLKVMASPELKQETIDVLVRMLLMSVRNQYGP